MSMVPKCLSFLTIGGILTNLPLQLTNVTVASSPAIILQYHKPAKQWRF